VGVPHHPSTRAAAAVPERARRMRLARAFIEDACGSMVTICVERIRKGPRPWYGRFSLVKLRPQRAAGRGGTTWAWGVLVLSLNHQRIRGRGRRLNIRSSIWMQGHHARVGATTIGNSSSRQQLGQRSPATMGPAARAGRCRPIERCDSPNVNSTVAVRRVVIYRPTTFPKKRSKSKTSAPRPGSYAAMLLRGSGQSAPRQRNGRRHKPAAANEVRRKMVTRIVDIAMGSRRGRLREGVLTVVLLIPTAWRIVRPAA